MTFCPGLRTYVFLLWFHIFVRFDRIFEYNISVHALLF